MVSLLCMPAAYAEEASEVGVSADSRVPLNLSIENIVVAEASTDDEEIKTEEVEKLTLDFETPQVKVRAKRYHEIGPLPGLALTKEEIPSNVQSISAKQIKDSRALSLTDLFNTQLQGVTVNDYQGNPFQMDVQYRGFTAGPQIGSPQGLSVFMDGIRVNEPFGDVVNWDMIPMNAIAGVDLFPGSNPIFGLNTLGGAFSLKTKDGFNFTDFDAEILAGSFGRKQLQIENGWNNGKIAAFGAATLFIEDGWRDDSPSEVNQFFGKVSYRSDKLDLHFSSLIVDTELVGNGLIPSEEYADDPTRVFTSPDTTSNRLQQFQLSAAFQVNDTFSITGQVYRRNSKRHAESADVYTDHEEQKALRNLDEGEEYTCLFETTNDYNLPDYYVYDLPGGDIFGLVASMDFSNPEFVKVFNFLTAASLDDALATLDPSSFNAELPDYYVAAALDQFQSNQNLINYIFNNSTDTIYGPVLAAYGEVTSYSNGSPSYAYQPQTSLTALKNATNDPFAVLLTGAIEFNYFTADGVQHILIIKPPTNADECIGDADVSPAQNLGTPYLDGNNHYSYVDGADNSVTAPGIVDGTPTAVFTDSQINQVTDGASIQFNWNTDKHKFMVGASVDRPTAEYITTQQLGLLTADREFYFAPDEIRDQYLAADYAIANNNFEGEQLTKSLYFSETWSPVETWHFNASARYNDTHGENRIKARAWGGASGSYVSSLAGYRAYPNAFDVCAPGEDCETGYTIPSSLDFLNAEESEEFSYYSLNPSLGVAWQAKPSLNVYANFAQGVRVPSVIELGCALDKTPVFAGTNGQTGEKLYMYKSLREKRSCSLPSTLSGDPYLPQIQAQTVEVGMRGVWRNNVAWNLSAYQTNIKDDLYMVSYFGAGDFFDSIGSTRRQGIEAGLSGQTGKWGYSVNYSLTDATFEDHFTTGSQHNSSSYEGFTGNYNYSRLIDVEPGATMPGVSRHNLNATVNYQVTPKWQVGLTAVAHSSSYVRGNENNKHQAGGIIYETVQTTDTSGQVKVARTATNNPGKTPGYIFFNFQTTYVVNNNLSFNLLVNNVFDTEYFSAGALGVNPFTEGTYGAIGADGYNHNSSEWSNTNFVAPGAPRAAWASVRYQF